MPVVKSFFVQLEIENISFDAQVRIFWFLISPAEAIEKRKIFFFTGCNLNFSDCIDNSIVPIIKFGGIFLQPIIFCAQLLYVFIISTNFYGSNSAKLEIYYQYCLQWFVYMRQRGSGKLVIQW